MGSGVTNTVKISAKPNKKIFDFAHCKYKVVTISIIIVSITIPVNTFERYIFHLFPTMLNESISNYE